MAEAEDDEIVIAGEIVTGGVECPLLRLRDGRVFALSNLEKASVEPGTALRLRGRLLRASTCQQGTAFAVSERLK